MSSKMVLNNVFCNFCVCSLVSYVLLFVLCSMKLLSSAPNRKKLGYWNLSSSWSKTQLSSCGIICNGEKFLWLKCFIEIQQSIVEIQKSLSISEQSIASQTSNLGNNVCNTWSINQRELQIKLLYIKKYSKIYINCVKTYCIRYRSSLPCAT